MSSFRRHIHPSRLTDKTVDEHPWFAELLRFWRPAGVPADEIGGSPASLRLAVRDGYLSFYCAGQVAAEVKFGLRVFQERAHHKYLGEDPGGKPLYLPVLPLTKAGHDTSLPRRLAVLAGWHGAEKSFIEKVIGANPDVLDLEVAITVPQEGKSRPAAVRIDLAALEPRGDGWCIALWEVKRAEDGRARSRTIPATVLHQHARYQAWLAQDTNAEAMITGMRESCRVLLRLREMAVHAGNTDIAPFGAVIRAVAEGAPLTLDRTVRYLIDETGDRTRSFMTGDHAEKLADAMARAATDAGQPSQRRPVVQVVEAGARPVLQVS